MAYGGSWVRTESFCGWWACRPRYSPGFEEKEGFEFKLPKNIPPVIHNGCKMQMKCSISRLGSQSGTRVKV
ncbi:hypothetical protein CEXT_490241 [Caerostris extrusa]|uniref:Uncharacterized protein n=1 Tax=Caerostris extrusa TaxID=172846 RepID=A0AAV4V5B3_CAEEX|nr:hypothetical protein CEXT_490241 [Caerostris extrusa]